MSILHLPVPYRIETLSPRYSAQVAQPVSQVEPAVSLAPFGSHIREDAPAKTSTIRPRLKREADFLVQLMVGSEPALRGILGRHDVAEQRQAAYGAALEARPSHQLRIANRDLGTV
jgi:hypothetical protein